MNAHSDWQELRGLSEEERKLEIDDYIDCLSEHSYALRNYNLENKLEDGIYLLPEMQQYLDRIKALVMSRGKE